MVFIDRDTGGRLGRLSLEGRVEGSEEKVDTGGGEGAGGEEEAVLAE